MVLFNQRKINRTKRDKGGRIDVATIDGRRNRGTKMILTMVLRYYESRYDRA